MTTPTIPIVFGGLIAWSIYRRVRRNIGRQQLRPKRSIVSLVIFSTFSILIFTFVHNVAVLLGFGGGLMLGAILGFVGLRLTKFETTDEGHFYTPNTYIGGALSVIFIGRMAYRLWLNHPDSTSDAQLFHSPLTLFVSGLLFGYYIVYYVGLFVHTHDKK